LLGQVAAAHFVSVLTGMRHLKVVESGSAIRLEGKKSPGAAAGASVRGKLKSGQ
jgi:hypothetical protein